VTTQPWSPDIVRLAGLVADGVRWAKANNYRVALPGHCMCPLGAASCRLGADYPRPMGGQAGMNLRLPSRLTWAFITGFEGGAEDSVRLKYRDAYRMGADYRRRAEEGKL
jgi:hypothetical protein